MIYNNNYNNGVSLSVILFFSGTFEHIITLTADRGRPSDTVTAPWGRHSFSIGWR